MNRRFRPEIPGRFILFVLAIIAVVMLFVSYTTGFSGGYIRTVAEYVFMPMQKGIEVIGNRISISSEEARTIEELTAENDSLKEEIKRLNSELSNVALSQSELESLRELFQLSQTYSNYEMTGAYVIGKRSSNWFETFTIDKGSDDGIETDMNVLAGDGLVGIVTSVGKNHATVRAIIDDSSNVSAMVASTGDNLIVSGSLKDMTSFGAIEMSGLEDTDDVVNTGDAIVTSNISDKYLPGILIGYVGIISEDANGLTKSGSVVPVADFKHLNEVLVIKTKKQTGD